MAVRQISEHVLAVGVIDWNRTIFDELIPLPDGTTYNSYLVRGSEKTVLIDTADPAFEEELITNLVRAGIEKIDYIVANHAEQDHSGSIPIILELFPAAKVIATPKCAELLNYLLNVPSERIKTVEDGEKLSLGDCTLEFIYAPFVHWPETMLTFLVEEGVLFSCDLFGAHFASGKLYVEDECAILEAAKRYYAEIMMPFRASITKHLERLSAYDITYIAPSHGPVHNNPGLIMDAYRDWVSDRVEKRVLIPYVSMHGSTAKMVRFLTDALMERGVDVRPYDLATTDIGELAKATVDAATIVIAAPTVLFGPHPKTVYAAFLVNVLRPKTRFATVIGSYGWGGKTVDTLKGMLSNLHAEFLEPVYIRGLPQEQDFSMLVALADQIAEKHKNLP